MNCIAAAQSRIRATDRRNAGKAKIQAGLLSVFLVACGSPATESASANDSLEYETHYTFKPSPSERAVTVELRLRQPRSLLREVRFQVQDPRFEAFDGEGVINRDGDVLIWSPPPAGGTISWRSSVLHERNSSGYDAWIGRDWGIFRAEDIVPRAATRTLKGASSTTTVSFELPGDWSVVTQYNDKEGVYEITHRERRFKQPTGWILVGKLGNRRDDIGNTRVTVAGPVKNGVRRLDMLALLNWTLPEIARVGAELPKRLTIISAGDPMWRGGLSAPSSLYIHADRPLISENGTSTLLHEVMHVALGLAAAPGYDWIVEGLAEYYSLELMRRSGTVAASRAVRSRESQRKWAEQSEHLCGPVSTGATTALAVTVLLDLDREIREESDERYSLDDLLPRILNVDDEVDLSLLTTAASDLIGSNPDTLHIDKLPGCRNMSNTDQ